MRRISRWGSGGKTGRPDSRTNTQTPPPPRGRKAVGRCGTHHHGLLVEELVRIVPPGGRRRTPPQRRPAAAAAIIEVDALHVKRADGDETHRAREAQQNHAHGEELPRVEGAGFALEHPELAERVNEGGLWVGQDGGGKGRGLRNRKSRGKTHTHNTCSIYISSSSIEGPPCPGPIFNTPPRIYLRIYLETRQCQINFRMALLCYRMALEVISARAGGRKCAVWFDIHSYVNSVCTAAVACILVML